VKALSAVKMGSISRDLSEIKPTFITPSESPHGAPPSETPETALLVKALSLAPHIEGGYFAETDRDPRLVPSPFSAAAASLETLLLAGDQRPGFVPGFRNASTTIHYLLSPNSPKGSFHRNRARTVHTLHSGRGRYVLVHEGDGKVESFVVGKDVSKGEKLQWIVEGGVWKASFLLADGGGEIENGSEGMGHGKSQPLLISETVVPGFEYCDHEFMSLDVLRKVVDEKTAKQLEWLVRTGD
jgi:uncharacterized protein